MDVKLISFGSYVGTFLSLYFVPVFSDMLLLIDENDFGFSIGTSFMSSISSSTSPISPSSSSFSCFLLLYFFTDDSFLFLD